MVGITIGVGEYYDRLAHLAGRAVQEKTGLKTVILNGEHFVSSGLPTPRHLKLRIFDFAQEDSILYFDADMACLNPWQPERFANIDALGVVAENASPRHVAIAANWEIPIGEYFNTGLMILNRQCHWNWLKDTEQFVRAEAQSAQNRLHLQTALNVTRHGLGLKLELLDRRYNWIGYGIGRLCYEIPVFMAHALSCENKFANIDFFERRYKPPFNWHIDINEDEMDSLKNRPLRLKTEDGMTLVGFNSDGTIAPPYLGGAGQYWFIHNKAGSLVLAICSDKQIMREFERTAEGFWRSVQRLERVVA